MEAHFLENIVSGESKFSPEPWYNRHGDCIEHKIASEAVVADRIDELLTLYRSSIDDRVIGYQIKGVQALISKFGLDGLLLECAADDDGTTVERISIVAILLIAFGEGPKTVGRRTAYARSFRGAAEASIPLDELVPA